MMTVLFVVQIIVLMFVLHAIDLLANINNIAVGPNHFQRKLLTIGTVSQPVDSLSLALR